MTPHSHKHAHGSEAGRPSHPGMDWRRLHRDWRTWLVIGLMLAAIGTYVLTLDDSLQPSGTALSGRPAASAPAGPLR